MDYFNGKADILEIPKDNRIIAGNNFINVEVSDKMIMVLLLNY